MSASPQEPKSLSAAAEPSASLRKRQDILTLKKCPQCEYSLEGLPFRYRCPECGFEYDGSMFVVYGWARVQDRPRFWRLATLGLLSAVVVGMAVVGIVAGGSWERYLFPAVVLGVFAEALHRRSLRRRRGGEVQFAFSSTGCSQRRGPGKPEFRPWREFRRMRFRRVGRDAWRLRLTGSRWHLSLTTNAGSVILGGPRIDGVIECSRRGAAALRGEIRRRMRAARG